MWGRQGTWRVGEVSAPGITEILAFTIGNGSAAPSVHFFSCFFFSALRAEPDDGTRSVLEEYIAVHRVPEEGLCSSVR